MSSKFNICFTNTAAGIVWQTQIFIENLSRWFRLLLFVDNECE